MRSREQGMKMKKVLVTGGAGGLGRELAVCLTRLRDSVRVLDLPSCDLSPFEGMAGVEIFKGDIRDVDVVRHAVSDVDGVVHLAALLPPASERDRDATMSVNVGGTENLVTELARAGRDAHLVLCSSVCVYGDTTEEEPLVRTSHSRCALDTYAESKIEAERVVLGGGCPHTILRVSGISVPAFLEPPEVWPFKEDQRLEFVCRSDVAEALSACVHRPEAVGKVFNVAGGGTWQTLGRTYVARFSEVMGLPAEEAKYTDCPSCFDWYDTEESQAVLEYQRTSFDEFLALLERAIEEALNVSE